MLFSVRNYFKCMFFCVILCLLQVNGEVMPKEIKI